jgi:twitching motility protein PilJ
MRFKLFKLPRSRVWHSLAAVLAVMAIPLSVLVYEVYTLEQAEVEFAAKEDRGIKYLLPFHTVMRELAQHRGLSALYLGGNTGLLPALRAQTATVDETIVTMDAAEKTYGAEFDSEGRWEQMKKEWATLKSEVLQLSSAESTRRHNVIMDAALTKNIDVATDSNLILDPVAETYFMIDISVAKMPPLSNDMGRLRQAVVSAVDRGTFTNEDTLTISQYRFLVENDLAGIAEDFERAFRDDPVIRARLAPPFQRYTDSLKTTIDDIAAIQLQGARGEAFKYTADELFNRITAAIESVATFKVEMGATLTESLDQRVVDSRRNQYVYVGLGIGLTLLATLIAIIAIRNVTRPLAHLAAVAGQVAAGDSNARAQILRADEIGELAMQFDIMVDQQVASADKIRSENEQLNNSIISLLQGAAKLSQRDLTARVPVAEDVTGAISDAMNAMADETAKVLGQVVGVANQVALSAQEVRAQAASVMSVASAERVAVEKSAGQLEQASASMLQVADLAKQCNDAARRAIGTTETAQATVLGTVEGINSIRETIRETEKRIKRLGERSQEISGVVSLINSIAERTHILALNASMHAASAGEAGRGFAVVANEVQRLAENARDATSKIGTLVSNIQVETADTVVAMNDAITKVVSGTAMAERAGTEMKTTRDTTAELVQLVQQIASQSQAQAVVTESLRKQAAGIVVSSSETHDQLESQRGHTDLLVEYSDSLLASVNVFTLPKVEEVAPASRAVPTIRAAARRQTVNG